MSEAKEPENVVLIESKDKDDNREDKCSKVLVYVQVSLVVLFTSLAITLFMFTSSAKSEPSCTFWTVTDSTVTTSCLSMETYVDPSPCVGGPSDHPSMNVSGTFSKIFMTGGFVYLIDALCRLVIVYGLLRKSIWYQIGGVIGTIIVSTFATTALLVLIPVYRYNAAGSQCCLEDSWKPDPVPSYCSHMVSMLWIMVVIWFLSCFTSFAINQNDFQREFGELVPKVENEPE